jgi:hypothetical protein
MWYIEYKACLPARWVFIYSLLRPAFSYAVTVVSRPYIRLATQAANAAEKPESVSAALPAAKGGAAGGAAGAQSKAGSSGAEEKQQHPQANGDSEARVWTLEDEEEDEAEAEEPARQKGEGYAGPRAPSFISFLGL